MKILTVVGNRPQFIKAAAVSGSLRERHQELLVHTGQHHDRQLSEVFFGELELPHPDFNLGIAGGSNSSQCARMLAALAQLMEEQSPDALLVYGDTNSTLAAALAASQAATGRPLRRSGAGNGAPGPSRGSSGGVPVIHVEAGMRSFDRTMPEEVSRVLCDQLSALLLCPTASAAANLAAEGIGLQAEPAGRPSAPAITPLVRVTGDVMADLAMRLQPQAAADRSQLAALGVEPGGYLLLTSHRAGNVDPPERLNALVELIVTLAEDGRFGPVVLPIHPRTRERLRASGLERRLRACAALICCEPLGYLQTASLLCNARALLTDSGGMQKEAYLARVPCLTLRDRSEWTESVESGWNKLVDLDAQAAIAALQAPLPAAHPHIFGDGHAALRCVDAIDELAELIVGSEAKARAGSGSPAGAVAGGAR